MLSNPIEYCFVRMNRRFIRVDFNQLVYIEAKGTYCKLALLEGTHCLVHYRLKDWEQILPPKLFLRISKSNIVNLSLITAFNAEQVWIGEKKISISRERKAVLLQHPFVFMETKRTFSGVGNTTLLNRELEEMA